ncbi:unnamed protein product [Boreogadus saida]
MVVPDEARDGPVVTVIRDHGGQQSAEHKGPAALRPEDYVSGDMMEFKMGFRSEKRGTHLQALQSGLGLIGDSEDVVHAPLDDSQTSSPLANHRPTRPTTDPFSYADATCPVYSGLRKTPDRVNQPPHSSD